MARLLFTDVEPVERAFLGEPVREVLALVDWALAHEYDPGFEAGRALEAWARGRCRGAYRHQEQAVDNTPTPTDTTANPSERRVASDALRGVVPVSVALAGLERMKG